MRTLYPDIETISFYSDQDNYTDIKVGGASLKGTPAKKKRKRRGLTPPAKGKSKKFKGLGPGQAKTPEHVPVARVPVVARSPAQPVRCVVPRAAPQHTRAARIGVLHRLIGG